jgi:hypothetical protein
MNIHGHVFRLGLYFVHSAKAHGITVRVGDSDGYQEYRYPSQEKEDSHWVKSAPASGVIPCNSACGSTVCRSPGTVEPHAHSFFGQSLTMGAEP